jgi:hypothetical protein
MYVAKSADNLSLKVLHGRLCSGISYPLNSVSEGLGKAIILSPFPAAACCTHTCIVFGETVHKTAQQPR